MKTITKITLKTLITGLTCILMYDGCSVEEQVMTPELPKADTDTKEVLFSINIPGASPRDTRALGSSEESEVSSVEMLLFNPSTKKMVHNPVFANVITPDPSAQGNITKKSFTVFIPDGTYDVMIFANSRKAFNSVTLTSGESQEAALAKLKVSMPSGGWVANAADPNKRYLIPMWGMKRNVTVGQGTTIANVYMHRMVSRIDVRVTGTDAQTGNFTLKKINLNNVQKEGRIAPQLANWNENGIVNGTIPAGLATASSLVPGCGVYPSISYDSAIAPDNKGCEGSIYTFEAPKETTQTHLAPYLTIKGSFQGIEGWYRIDLADYSTMRYYDALRNTLYKINIAKVTGTGYPDEEDAKKNRADNMVVNITPWNKYELGGTEFSGQYFISLLPQDVVYDGQAHAGQTLTVKTDYEMPLTLADIRLSGSSANVNAPFVGGWINSLSLSSGSAGNNMNEYTLTYNIDRNDGGARTGYVYVTVNRMTVVARIAQEEGKLAATPDQIILSPFPGHDTKTIRISSNGPWTLVAQPANATVSPTNGLAGTTDLTVTRSTTTFGLSSFTIQNTVTNKTAIVFVDNCYFLEDELLLSNSAGTNTGTYTIEVEGGRKTFTIEGYSPWITSAVILPNGDLQITAPQNQNGLERTGYITLSHTSDPDYKVTYQVLQDINGLPPFDYLTVRFTWGSTLDADLAVEFANNVYPASGGYLPFDNTPYYSGTTSSDNIRRSVGYRQATYISVNGMRVGTINNGTVSSSGFATGVPEYTPEMLKNGLMFFGGDAQSGQGETVFLNAPQVTPPSRREDKTGMPRYLNLEVYAAWYRGSGTYPITVTVNTYTGGIMLKPDRDAPNQNLFTTNFYNVATGTTSLTSSAQVLAPDFNESYTIQCDKHAANETQASSFRSVYHHVCTIRYDRYRRDAKVTWH